MYDQKRQVIEDKKKKRQDDVIQKCTAAREQAEKARISAESGMLVSLAPFTTIAGWVVAAFILVGAYTFGGPPAAIATAVLWFAGVTGIGILIAVRSGRKADRETGMADEEQRRTLERAEQDYQNELRQLDLWYQDYEEKVSQRAVQYASGTEAPRLAQKMGYQFEHMIETYRRDPTVKMIEVDFDYRVEAEHIYYLSHYAIDFEQERLNPLQSGLQCEALAQALARIIKENVLNRYPQGQVKISHDDAWVSMHYTGVNPGHVPRRNI